MPSLPVVGGGWSALTPWITDYSAWPSAVAGWGDRCCGYDLPWWWAGECWAHCAALKAAVCAFGGWWRWCCRRRPVFLGPLP